MAAIERHRKKAVIIWYAIETSESAKLAKSGVISNAESVKYHLKWRLVAAASAALKISA
jgi:hypothetical protein